MKLYKDTEGTVVEATQLTGPSIIDTISGEKVGEAGDYLLYLPNSKPVILSPEVFISSFTLVG